MNTRMLIAALAASVAAFFLGWLIWGIAMESDSRESMNEVPGFTKAMENMRWKALIVANLASGCLYAYILFRMGAGTAMAGLIPGAIIGALITLHDDLIMYTFTNMFSERMYLLVDAVAGAVHGAGVGLVAGLVLGMGKKG